MSQGSTIILILVLAMLVYLAAKGKLSKVWTAVKS